MAESKKKVTTFRIVVIIIGVIIILLILLLLFWYFMKIFIKTSITEDYSGYNYTNYTNETALENLEGDLPNLNPQDLDSSTPDAGQDDKKREYKTSDKLSEITFTRAVDYQEEYITWKLNINIKVTGYLQEIDPTTSNLNRVIDRVYVFKDSNVDYDLSGSEIKQDDSDLCRFEYYDVGKGSKPIEELNVDTGDVKRTMVPSAGWGSWALTYTKYGFYSDTPEIALEGDVLLPIVETVVTTKLSDHAICGDYYNFVPLKTTNIALSPTFPLRLNNVDINQKSHSGNLEAEDNAGEDHSGTVADATFEQAQLDLPIDLPYDAPGNWKVSYNINLP